MYFSAEDRGQFNIMMHNWPQDDVEIIVVTDGSRILGLGDLGVNGMGIPIGKLALYISCGGIHPRRVLPVVIDVGTNNASLLADPWYLGLQQPRLTGPDYYSLVHEFVKAAHSRWPNALIQFEDFSSDVASNILETYRYDHLVFNDDIQGTGCVVVASLMAAIRTQSNSARLSDQRIVICGAGSAGIGIAASLYDAMIHEGADANEARQRVWVCDKDGLLGPERDRDSLAPEQVFFTRDHASGVPATRDGGPGVHGVGLKDKSSLADVVRSVSPTILIGVTAVGGAFSEEVVREMTARVPRPIIFPLSNPTTHAECTAEQAFRWSEGRAIVASGSPFSDVTIDGRVFHCTQTNNMCVRGAGEGAPCRRPHVFLSHPRPHPHPQVRLPRHRPRRQRGARQAHLG